MAARTPALDVLQHAVDAVAEQAAATPEDWDAASAVASMTMAALSTRGRNPQSLERFAALAHWPRASNDLTLAGAQFSDVQGIAAVVSTPSGDVRATDLVAVAVVELASELIAHGVTPPRDVVTSAARTLATIAAERYPGKTIEVRVPPAAAVQIGFGRGPVHTRGTPPNVIETDPKTFVLLGTGRLTWSQARADRTVTASGDAADLSPALPLVPGIQPTVP